jgi:hypothetical protein
MIVYNAIQTPDGTILESRHRHDYNTHVDKNGQLYMVDGGLNYLRRAGQGYKELSVSTENATFEELRAATTWGTRGKTGDDPLTYLAVKDMTTEHIEAVLDHCSKMYPQIKYVMKMELEYRK